jgi:hypothetical protein
LYLAASLAFFASVALKSPEFIVSQLIMQFDLVVVVG